MNHAIYQEESTPYSISSSRGKAIDISYTEPRTVYDMRAWALHLCHLRLSPAFQEEKRCGPRYRLLLSVQRGMEAPALSTSSSPIPRHTCNVHTLHYTAWKAARSPHHGGSRAGTPSPPLLLLLPFTMISFRRRAVHVVRVSSQLPGYDGYDNRGTGRTGR